jgi:hypothetical protein
VLVYRLDVGLDVGLFGELGEDMDSFLRVNAAIGALAGPATIGIELVNLINPDKSGDDAMLHTVSAGVRGDFSGIQPGIALTFPLDDEFSEMFGTVLQLSVRGQL